MTDDVVDGVAVEVDGAVLRLRLDRPERKNALDVAAVARLVDALEVAAVDDSLRAVVLTGAGDHFCAGADWVAANAGGGPRPRTGSLQRRVPLQAHRLVQLLLEVQLPVVCGVRGWAAGLGCQLALAADVTVVTTSARLWEPFVQRGFTPDSGATWLLPRLVGLARARDLLLLGRELTGAEAAEWGLVHRAVDEDELDGAVGELVDRLASGPTVALGLTKRLLQRSLESPLGAALEGEAAALELAARAGDFKEGLAAFGDRRPPEFEGR